jgi:hypothetical protein
MELIGPSREELGEIVPRHLSDSIKNPVEHHKDVATGPEQRRGRMLPSEGIKRIRQSPSTWWIFYARQTIDQVILFH